MSVVLVFLLLVCTLALFIGFKEMVSMKRVLLLSSLFSFVFFNICSADIYTKQMSNLGAERFVQEYNSSTYNEHGEMEYFVKPELSTPTHWRNIWPYNLWRTKSIDGKYTLEITVDKKDM